MTSHTSIIYISTIKAENIDQVSLLHSKIGAMLDILWTDLQFTYYYFVLILLLLLLLLLLLYSILSLHNAGYIFHVAKGLLILLLH
jgi:hypothetical protein